MEDGKTCFAADLTNLKFMAIKINPSILILYYQQMNKDSNVTPCTPDFESPRPCRSLLRINRKKEKRIRHCHQKKSNKKIGMWNLDETIKYISFVKKNFQKFQNQDTRRKMRVFSVMRKQIRTRSAIQCRSHHQKMVQTYGNLEDIIMHYENKVIPYYEARVKERQVVHKIVQQPIPFCVLVQSNNHFRIQIHAQMILNY